MPSDLNHRVRKPLEVQKWDLFNRFICHSRLMVKRFGSVQWPMPSLDHLTNEGLLTRQLSRKNMGDGRSNSAERLLDPFGRDGIFGLWLRSLLTTSREASGLKAERLLGHGSSEALSISQVKFSAFQAEELLSHSVADIRISPIEPSTPKSFPHS